MSATDKSKNKAQEIAGQVEEKTGQLTGDEHLESHGKTEQTKGNLKQAGEKLKDAGHHRT